VNLTLRTTCFALLVFATASTTHAEVLTVAPAGGDFTNIQDAISAAADGDVILVKSGAYPGFSITDRALAIVEDDGHDVSVQGPVSVTGLSADRDVVIDDLDLLGGGRFSATDCIGALRIQDCRIAALLDPNVSIASCSDVVFVNCALDQTGNANGRGLVATQSNLAVYATTVHGGPGYSWSGDTVSVRGADAVQIEAGYLFSSGSSFVGGAGETGDWYVLPVWCNDGGSGGAALVASQGCIVECFETTRTGGAPGLGGCVPGSQPGFAGCDCADGFSGSPFTLLSGATLLDWPFPARRMSIASPLREKTSASLKVHGLPGDTVRLASTIGTQFAFDPASFGLQVFEPTALSAYLRALGTIDASGELGYKLELPDLGPGIAARTLYMQAIFRDQTGLQFLGTPRIVVVLDSAY
jgi:hypothetical protein